MEVFSLPLCLLEWVDGAIQSSASGQPVKCALLCAAEKKERERKREGEEKKLSPFVCRGLSRKAILQLLQLAGKASLVPLICTHLYIGLSHSAHCLYKHIQE